MFAGTCPVGDRASCRGVARNSLLALQPHQLSIVLTGLTSLRCSSKAPRILQQQDQLPFVLWRRLEAKTAIERLGICVDGVCQQSPDTRVLSYRDRPADSVLQQTDAKTLPLVVEIDGKPRQNEQRDRVLAHPATNPLGRVERVDLADGQAEVPGNAIPIADDEGSRRTATLSLACVAQQPVGESWFSAVERFQPMTRISGCGSDRLISWPTPDAGRTYRPGRGCQIPVDPAFPETPGTGCRQP